MWLRRSSTIRGHARRLPRDHGLKVGALDGTWFMMSGRLGGITLPDNAFAGLTVTVRSDRFELGLDRGRIIVDGTRAPAALDLLIVAGPNRGRYVPGIIGGAGPFLRICYDLGGTERPSAFLAPAGTRYFLATYRRALAARDAA
jgi:uncharacterized protein (TIGR03067 family)